MVTCSPPRPILYQNFSVFVLVDHQRFGRTMQVALGIWRTHFDLAFFIQISLRNSDRSNRFENQIILFLYFIWHEPIGDAAGNHDVIFSAISLFPENGLECAAAFEYKDDLVGATITVILEFAVSLFRARTIRDHILIKQNRNTTSDRNLLCEECRPFSNGDDEAGCSVAFFSSSHFKNFTSRTRVGGRKW